MKCPHCTIEIHPEWTEDRIGKSGPMGVEAIGVRRTGTSEGSALWGVKWMACPACRQAIIQLTSSAFIQGRGVATFPPILAFPRAASRPAAAAEVPSDLAEDFNEACSVVALSPKSAAALARRCLQSLLQKQGYTQRDLVQQIQAVLAAKMLPAWLADNVDSVRNIGNFAAHPLKDTNTGAILPVEEHEADWNLDVLEGLFDHYYVQPAKDKARRDALNAKLQAAGKPPLK